MSVLALFLTRSPLLVFGSSARGVRARWEPVCACAAARCVIPEPGARSRHVSQDTRQPLRAWLEERPLLFRKVLRAQLAPCVTSRALHLPPGPGCARPGNTSLEGRRNRTDRPETSESIRTERPETPGSNRDSEAAKRRLAELYENPWTIPNALSMTRIGLAPVLGYLIVAENFNIALGVFILAGITDLLDGFIARNWANQKSALGSALDPLADKILISVLYICLTYAHLIPVPLTIMIILRDIALIAAVFYVRYKTLPPPRTVSKYFNPCYVTAHLEPTFISKMNTAVQLILVAASLAAPVFNYVDSVYLQMLWCITGFTTAASAYSYYHYGQETVKVLKNK